MNGALPLGATAKELALGGYAKHLPVIRDEEGRLEVFYIGTGEGIDSI